MTIGRPILDARTSDMYRLALDFLSQALGILDSVPAQRRELRSQLQCAAMSARGSAMECGALLDVCRLMGHASSERAEVGKRLFTRIVEMLTNR